MPKSFVTEDKDQGFANIIKNLKELAFNDINVGFFDGDPSADGSMTMAELALLQTKGSSKSGTQQFGEIPSRDFMAETAILYEDDVANDMTRATKKVIDGSSDIKGILEDIGDEYAQNMKDTVDDFSSPPNTKYTIEHKTFVKQDNPLVDTGEMRDNIKPRVSEKF